MLFERASHCYHSIHQEPNFWWVCHKIYGYRAVEQFNADEVYKINFKVWDNMNNRKLFSKQQSWLIANKLGSSYSKLSMLKLKLQVIKRWLTNSCRIFFFFFVATQLHYCRLVINNSFTTWWTFNHPNTPITSVLYTNLFF